MYGVDVVCEPISWLAALPRLRNFGQAVMKMQERQSLGVWGLKLSLMVIFYVCQSQPTVLDETEAIASLSAELHHQLAGDTSHSFQDITEHLALPTGSFVNAHQTRNNSRTRTSTDIYGSLEQLGIWNTATPSHSDKKVQSQQHSLPYETFTTWSESELEDVWSHSGYTHDFYYPPDSPPEQKTQLVRELHNPGRSEFETEHLIKNYEDGLGFGPSPLRYFLQSPTANKRLGEIIEPGLNAEHLHGRHSGNTCQDFPGTLGWKSFPPVSPDGVINSSVNYSDEDKFNFHLFGNSEENNIREFQRYNPDLPSKSDSGKPMSLLLSTQQEENLEKIEELKPFSSEYDTEFFDLLWDHPWSKEHFPVSLSGGEERNFGELIKHHPDTSLVNQQIEIGKICENPNEGHLQSLYPSASPRQDADFSKLNCRGKDLLPPTKTMLESTFWEPNLQSSFQVIEENEGCAEGFKINQSPSVQEQNPPIQLINSNPLKRVLESSSHACSEIKNKKPHIALEFEHLSTVTETEEKLKADLLCVAESSRDAIMGVLYQKQEINSIGEYSPNFILSLPQEIKEPFMVSTQIPLDMEVPFSNPTTISTSSIGKESFSFTSLTEIPPKYPEKHFQKSNKCFSRPFEPIQEENDIEGNQSSINFHVSNYRLMQSKDTIKDSIYMPTCIDNLSGGPFNRKNNLEDTFCEAFEKHIMHCKNHFNLKSCFNSKIEENLKEVSSHELKNSSEPLDIQMKDLPEKEKGHFKIFCEKEFQGGMVQPSEVNIHQGPGMKHIQESSSKNCDIFKRIPNESIIQQQMRVKGSINSNNPHKLFLTKLTFPEITNNPCSTVEIMLDDLKFIEAKNPIGKREIFQKDGIQEKRDLVWFLSFVKKKFRLPSSPEYTLWVDESISSDFINEFSFRLYGINYCSPFQDSKKRVRSMSRYYDSISQRNTRQLEIILRNDEVVFSAKPPIFPQNIHFSSFIKHEFSKLQFMLKEKGLWSNFSIVESSTLRALVLLRIVYSIFKDSSNQKSIIQTQLAAWNFFIDFWMNFPFYQNSQERYDPFISFKHELKNPIFAERSILELRRFLNAQDKAFAQNSISWKLFSLGLELQNPKMFEQFYLENCDLEEKLKRFLNKLMFFGFKGDMS